MITMGSAVDADLLRLRDEFLAMPALVLTAMRVSSTSASRMPSRS